MGDLSKQILSGDIPTPMIGQQLAEGGWYAAPEGPLNRTDVNRAREGLARIVSRTGERGVVNTALFEGRALAGEYGKPAMAIAVALAKALLVAAPSDTDSSLAEWKAIYPPAITPPGQ